MWLDTIGCSEYKEIFKQHDITGPELVKLERQDLIVSTVSCQFNNSKTANTAEFRDKIPTACKTKLLFRCDFIPIFQSFFYNFRYQDLGVKKVGHHKRIIEKTKQLSRYKKSAKASKWARKTVS